MDSYSSNNEIQKILQSIKDSKGNYSIYDHLQNLYEIKLKMQDDQKFIDLFEDISLRLKVDGKYLEDNIKNNHIFKYLDEFNKNSNKINELVGPLVKKEEDGEINPVNQVGYVPDYLNLFNYFEWVNLSLGQKDNYLLTNSLRNLVNAKGVNAVVFWGKIYGTEKDYYIAEADVTEAGDVNELEPAQEPRGTGANSKIYFVTNDLTEDWVQLDDVRPSHLKASRLIKVLFSGNLNRKIVTNPHFPGLEKDYLRCQIARISHNNTLVPNIPLTGQFKVLQDNNREIEKDDGVKPPKINDLLSLNNWAHYLPSILKEGRVVHMEREPPQDVEPDVFKKEIESKDPFAKRLQPIIEDMALPSSIPGVKIPAWKLSFVYDDKIYINPGIKLNPDEEDPNNQKDNTASYTIVHLRNLRWPGANVVYLKGDVHHLYFGWGHKFSDSSLGEKFVYQDFPVIPKDIVDLEEFPEPNYPPSEPVNDEDGGNLNENNNNNDENEDEEDD